MKYLTINLTKDVKDLYMGNNESLLREMKPRFKQRDMLSVAWEARYF